jgi:hypothetical protein
VSEHNPAKLLALKIASLPSKDRDWLISRLPESQRQILLTSLKSVKQFSLKNSSLIVDRLSSTSENSSSNESTDSTIKQVSLSDMLYKHCCQIRTKQISVSESTRAFVNAYLKRESAK